MNVTANIVSDQNKNAAAKTATRLVSVDALRGFDMFWILGGDYVIRSLVSIHDSVP